MKTQVITWKWISLLLILMILMGYQYVQMGRAAEAKQAELENQIAVLTMEKEQAEEAINTWIQAVSGEPEKEQSEDTEGKYSDGTWQGTGLGFGGDITAEVTVENGKITEITVVSSEYEDQEYMDMASKMIPVIIEGQDPDVDTVTGATLSSVGLRDAVSAALQAGNES